MKNQSQDMPLAGLNGADPVAHLDLMVAARAPDGPAIDGKDHPVALA